MRCRLRACQEGKLFSSSWNSVRNNTTWRSSVEVVVFGLRCSLVDTDLRHRYRCGLVHLGQDLGRGYFTPEVPIEQSSIVDLLA